jgi:predicted acetyltransferase
MSAIEIREITGEEMVEIFYKLPSYAFRPTPPLPDEEEFKKILRRRAGVRAYAAFEDGQAVACAGGHAMLQNIRGSLYPMCGVFGVATHPGARRKGYAKRTVARLLTDFCQEGTPLSCLYPFRESFYERLGYATFPQHRWVKFSTTNLAPILKQDPGGRVHLHLIADGFEDYTGLLDKLLPRTHGMGLFQERRTVWAIRNEHWLALARVNGEVVGAMIYILKGEDLGKFTLRALRFLYLTSQGRYLLLDWIARHIDQATTAEIRLPAHDYPETWISDLDFKTEPDFLAPMGRVLDISAIGGIPVGPGNFSAHIRDPYCPWNEGSWSFENQDGKLVVKPAASAEVELSIQALAALVYGVNDPSDFRFRAWGDPPPAIQTTLQEMFTRQSPYLYEAF